MPRPKKPLSEKKPRSEMTPLEPAKTIDHALLNAKTEAIRRMYSKNVSLFDICKLTGRSPLFVINSLDLEYADLNEDEKTSFNEALILDNMNSRRSRYTDLNTTSATDLVFNGSNNRLLNR